MPSFKTIYKPSSIVFIPCTNIYMLPMATLIIGFPLKSIAFLFLISALLIGPGESVPAIYTFGDSLVDVGNNNFISASMLKADFPHNGVDFPTGMPTGRFSNGKNSADFLGMYCATINYTFIPIAVEYIWDYG